MLINTHSYYSLRYGTITPEDLLCHAKSAGYTSIAITDINNTSASWHFVRLAAKHQIKPILGVDFRNGATQKFIMLAKNNEGFYQINTYLSQFLHQKTYQIPEYAPTLNDTYVIYPFSSYVKKASNNLDSKTQSIPQKKHFDLEAKLEGLNPLMGLKENEYLGVAKEDLNRLAFSPWRNHQDKLVILQTVSFENKKGFNTHRLLRAIANNTLLSKLSKEEQGEPWHQMLPKTELEDAFAAYPELLKNTNHILSECSITFDFETETINNQRCFTSSEQEDIKLLKNLAYQGIAYRYENPSKAVTTRIEKELQIIKERGFVSYFLINWEILNYARSKGYFYVGRGSGANSIIAYLLRITDVDPVELDLYFERFINLYRKNPPDFDIDFSWTDRDDITDFIFKRFKNTALISVYNTFKYRAAIRELGKVFGLPKSEIDVLSSGQYQYQQLDQLSQLVITYSALIQGFPNYLGIHASGIIISEKPMHYHTATFMPPKGFPTTHFDMLVAEDIGLFKFDILSQRGLGKIKDTVAIVKYNRPELPQLDIHDIKRFKKDERIKHILKNAKAIGCFYVESPAMRMLLKKLRVDNYLGLVAASSVIRPGVAKSGMMREYILRYRYPERRKDAHPVLLDIMPETYGVMVYQEDVIKVAHHFGGLDLGEADMLRRGMSGKYRSRDEFLKVKDSFFDNCKRDGKAKQLTEDIWRQIESFAGYAFAKGHSASYAVESYQSLYLKAYFPLEYMVATLNNFGGFYSTELYVHEARMHGGTIEAPCINRSFTQTVIYGKQLFLGMQFLQALHSNTIKQIVTERTKNGSYLDLDDFIDRISISMEQIAILIKIDAFRYTRINKRELLWQAHLKINKTPIDAYKSSLFKTERIQYQMPKLATTQLENAFDEIELLGFPLCSPFHLLKEIPKSNALQAKYLINFLGKLIRIDGYLVTTKKTVTSKGKLMFFGTFLDRKGDFIDTVHFPPIAKKFPFRGKGIYRITGKVIEEFDCITVEVSEMLRMPIVTDPRYTEYDLENEKQIK